MTTRRQFTKARILIIGDEPASVEVLRRLLERGGFSRIDQAITEIERQRGRHFDPALVDAFLRIIEHHEKTSLR